MRSIGASAFAYCYGLENVQIGNNVTTLGRSAFWYCGLKSITIPDNVTSIGSQAFGDCGALESITIGNGVTSIGDNAFKGCRLKNITFQGLAPTAGLAFDRGLAAEGATAYVYPQFADSFGGLGSTWEGLTVVILKPTITACGLLTPTTFFIEFEPAGEGYRVMSSPTLDFGNAVEVRPTLQPTSGDDNRFEFTASGSRNFYRLELTE